jgi:dTDP-glucose pyrophosphorylase/CBS domain-containing protein
MRWGGDGRIDMKRLCVDADATLFDALAAIDRGAESIAFVCDNGRVIGSLTDGDARRALLAGTGLQDRCLRSAMRSDFSFVSPAVGRAEVLDIMRARDIGQLPILDPAGRLVGLHTVGRILSGTQRDNWAVIMAGGRGSRLQPITETVPKAMVKVAGRPILERLVLHLMGCGLRRFFISVNYMAEVIESHFGDGARFGCEIDYLRETQPLGTGGSLSLLSPKPERPIVVINGDLITQCDVGDMIDFHDNGGYAATFGVKAHSVQIPFGVARVEGNCLVELREKPTERMLINAGIYVLSPEVLRLIPAGQEHPITDLFNRCLSDGLRVGAHMVHDDWIDVGQFQDLRRARGDA